LFPKPLHKARIPCKAFPLALAEVWAHSWPGLETNALWEKAFRYQLPADWDDRYGVVGGSEKDGA
jgi:hypothetical protein